MARLRVKEVMESQGLNVAELYRRIVTLHEQGRLNDLVSQSLLNIMVLNPNHMPKMGKLAVVAQALGVRLSDLIDETQLPVNDG